MGLRVNEAHRLIAEAGFAVGRLQRTLTDRHPDGLIIAQSPRPQTRVRPGTAIGLTVAESGVRVPHLWGMHISKAAKILGQAGLVPGNITRSQRSGMAQDTVISQWPAAGNLIRRGNRVNLTIAIEAPTAPPSVYRDPAPPVYQAPTSPPAPYRTPSPPPDIYRAPTPPVLPVPMEILKPCTIPNVIGGDEKRAIAMLRAAGFGYRIVSRLSGNRISRQTPAPGAKALCGSTVELIVGTIY